jgi:hypothetical protein
MARELSVMVIPAFRYISLSVRMSLQSGLISHLQAYFFAKLTQLLSYSAT